MIRDELQRLDTSPRALRRFGLMVGGVLGVLGALWLWRHKAPGPWCLGIGLTLLLLAAAAPQLLRPVHRAWMTVAFVLGTMMTTVFLTLAFFLVITPIGLLARLSGRDFLRQRRGSADGTYWLPRHAPGGRRYDRQG